MEFQEHLQKMNRSTKEKTTTVAIEHQMAEVQGVRSLFPSNKHGVGIAKKIYTKRIISEEMTTQKTSTMKEMTTQRTSTMPLKIRPGKKQMQKNPSDDNNSNKEILAVISPSKYSNVYKTKTRIAHNGTRNTSLLNNNGIRISTTTSAKEIKNTTSNVNQGKEEQIIQNEIKNPNKRIFESSPSKYVTRKAPRIAHNPKRNTSITNTL